METLLEAQSSVNSQAFQPVLIKDVLLLSEGIWNGDLYSEDEIKKAYLSTNWGDKSVRSLYMDHQDTKERGVANWVGFVINPRIVGKQLRGDLEVWNPILAVYLTQAKAKFGISATLSGTENSGAMQDFRYESFSLVVNPACKPALINLSQKNGVSKVVTLENIVELESVKHADRKEEAIENPLTGSEFDMKLAEMIKDEAKAPGDYENLKSLTEHEECKNKIDGIIADEKRHHEILLEIKNHEMKENSETSGSPTEAHALEPVHTDKKKEDEEEVKKENSIVELDAIFERQVGHIKDSLKKEHPDWSDKKVEQVAYATANKIKSEHEKENAEKCSQSLSEQNQRGNSDNETLLKGGLNNMPENKELESVAKQEVAELNAEVKTEELKEAPKSEDKSEEPSEKEDDKEDKEEDKKEELSAETILSKVKEMSAEETVEYAEFARTYLSSNASASAKEVTLAYMKAKAEKAAPKELSATDLLAALDQKISSLRELNSTSKLAEMEQKVKELEAKVKAPNRKTLAFDSSTTDANLGMLNFLKHGLSE